MHEIDQSFLIGRAKYFLSKLRDTSDNSESRMKPSSVVLEGDVFGIGTTNDRFNLFRGGGKFPVTKLRIVNVRF